MCPLPWAQIDLAFTLMPWSLTHHAPVISVISVVSLCFISLQYSNCASLNIEVSASVFLFCCFEDRSLNSTSSFDLLWLPCVADADVIFLPCGFFYLSFLLWPPYVIGGPLYFCSVVSFLLSSSSSLFFLA